MRERVVSADDNAIHEMNSKVSNSMKRRREQHLLMQRIKAKKKADRDARLSESSSHHTPWYKKTIAYLIFANVRDVMRHLRDVCREEHTVAVMINPQDDTELTPAQTIQLFWTVLMLELLLICFNFTPPSASERCS